MVIRSYSPTNTTNLSRKVAMVLICTLSVNLRSTVHCFLLHRPAGRPISTAVVLHHQTGCKALRRFASTTTDTVYPAKLEQNELVKDAPVIVLQRSRQSKAFRNGNQLVFTKAIQRGQAPTCALVQVAVDDDVPKKNTTNDKNKSASSEKFQKTEAQPIGWGVWNPDSLYKVRILCHRYLQPTLYQKITQPEMNTQEALKMIVQYHVKVAVRKRTALCLPNPGQNTMFRLVNGEGDSLSGLQIDVIDSHVVVQSSAAWTEVHKELILDAIQEVTNYDTIVWKVAGSRLKQDGYTGIVTSEKKDDEEESQTAEAVIALENGVKFRTFPTLDGQKTGVYCDQRENRHTLSKFTQGKTVLDLCCFHGGFSLTALVQGGAISAVGVDSSAAAVEAAKENAKLNNCDDKASFVQADISKYMQSTAADGGTFDVVCLDPPKLAPTVASLDKARRKYHGLNRDAVKLVNPTEGGLLMTCTCSAAMTQKDGGQYFLNMVSGAAQAAGRQLTLLSKAGAASCHTQSPVSWPAGAYLTAALFYVHPAE